MAIVALVLSVAALIVVFSVEHLWFSDSYNQTNNNFNYYGLWRLCFFPNQTCDGWFSTGGPFSLYVYDRLNQAKGNSTNVLSNACAKMILFHSSRYQCMASVGNRLFISHSIVIDHCFTRVYLLSISMEYSLLSSDSCNLLRMASR